MKIGVAERLAGYRDSVFDEMEALARQYGAVNLGPGTPDIAVPAPLVTAAANAIANGRNQYSPIRGEMALREAIAAHARRFYGQQIDPETEVTVTSGVTEGMQAAIFSIIQPGDEVVVFEPFYDSYVPCIEMAGGVPVAVTLHAPSFRFRPEELRAAFSSRTKALILNTPHNPTGIVFSGTELDLIAALCQEFDVLAITDEVYEHIVFDDVKPVRLATLPGMWERTLTLSGAGKTFSCTGWRIGWAIGPAAFHDALARFRQFTVFCSATPLQHAVAEGLALPDSYFPALADEYRARRDLLTQTLCQCGLDPSRAEGGFFLLADISRLTSSSGREFCYELARQCGVVAIPTDTFYLNRRCGEELVRFTFCVRRESIQTAAQRLAKLPALYGAPRV
jgi:N-succinyldiaminopimelate aminotransferase